MGKWSARRCRKGRKHLSTKPTQQTNNDNDNTPAPPTGFPAGRIRVATATAAQAQDRARPANVCFAGGGGAGATLRPLAAALRAQHVAGVRCLLDICLKEKFSNLSVSLSASKIAMKIAKLSCPSSDL